LRAALSDDARRSRRPLEHTAKHDRMQLRVESLMERARYHLERDELQEAQRAAELAQKVVKYSDLEFAPDDERPADLLVRIAERIQPEPEQSSESRLALNPAESEPTTPAEPTADDASKPQDSDQQIDFDPYAADAPPEGPTAESSPLLESSFVVLQTPSFDEVAEVNPTAYTASTDEMPAQRKMSLAGALPHFRRSMKDADSASPVLDDDIAPPPPELKVPSSPAEDRSGPRFGPVEMSDLPLDDEEEQANAEAEEVHAAGLWPRWLPLSILSLLTTAFSIWFWRRRAALAAG
jgi:hypothetical protein